jgi:hypothetical protein
VLLRPSWARLDAYTIDYTYPFGTPKNTSLILATEIAARPPPHNHIKMSTNWSLSPAAEYLTKCVCLKGLLESKDPAQEEVMSNFEPPNCWTAQDTTR